MGDTTHVLPAMARKIKIEDIRISSLLGPSMKEVHVGDSASFGETVESGSTEAIGSNPGPHPSQADREQEGGEWGSLEPQLSEEFPTPANSCIPQLGQVTSLLPRAHGSRESKALALPHQDACAGMSAMLSRVLHHSNRGRSCIHSMHRNPLLLKGPIPPAVGKPFRPATSTRIVAV